MDATAIQAALKEIDDMHSRELAYVYSTAGQYYWISSQTSEAVFDDSKEMMVMIRANANPVRDTAGQPPFEVFFLDYGDISGIGVYADAQSISEGLSYFSQFDPDKMERFFKLIGAQHQASGFAYPKGWKEPAEGETPKLKPGEVYNVPNIM